MTDCEHKFRGMPGSTCPLCVSDEMTRARIEYLDRDDDDPITPPPQCPACGYDPIPSRPQFWLDDNGTCTRCDANWREVLLHQARERIAELERLGRNANDALLHRRVSKLEDDHDRRR